MKRQKNKPCKRVFKKCAQRDHGSFMGYINLCRIFYVQVIMAENMTTYTHIQESTHKTKSGLYIYHLAQFIKANSSVFLVIPISATVTVSHFSNLCVSKFIL